MRGVQIRGDTTLSISEWSSTINSHIFSTSRLRNVSRTWPPGSARCYSECGRRATQIAQYSAASTRYALTYRSTWQQLPRYEARNHGVVAATRVLADDSELHESVRQNPASQSPASEDLRASTTHAHIEVLKDHKQLKTLKDKHWQEYPQIVPSLLLSAKLLSSKLKAFARSGHNVIRCPKSEISTTLLSIAAKAMNLDLRVIDTSSPEFEQRGSYLYLFKGTSALMHDDGSFRDLCEFNYDSEVVKSFGNLYEEILSLIQQNPKPFFDNHLDVLLTLCSHNIEALPRMHMFNREGGELTPESPPEEFKIVRLTNEKFHLVVEKDLDIGLDTMTSLCEAMLEYCKRVYHAAASPDQPYLSFEGRDWDAASWLGKAASAMHLGSIAFHVCKIGELVASGPRASHFPPLPVYQTNVKAMGVNIGQPVFGFYQKQTRRRAILDACVELKSRMQQPKVRATVDSGDFGIFASYWDTSQQCSLKAEGQQAVEAVNPISVSGDILTSMVSALKEVAKEQLQLCTDWTPAFDTPEPKSRSSTSLHRDDQNEKVKQRTTSKALSVALPIRQSAYVQSIVEAVQNHDITIIRAATGSGKTTQVPQMLYDAPAFVLPNILITQPRRVSTVTVAQRVASERNQRLGLEVGYQVRWEDHSPISASGITFMTSGYLNRLLDIEPRKICRKYSHIILDEVHDRDIDTDMLLTTFKELRTARPDEFPSLPKIVLMSATINPDFFQQYFADSDGLSPTIASIDVPGRLFPVRTMMLDDMVPLLTPLYPDVLSKDDLNGYIESQLRTTPPGGDEADIGGATDIMSTEEEQEQSVHDDLEDSKTDQTANLETQVELDTKYVPFDLILLTIDHLAKTSQEGDILVFLPGLSEIDALHQLLLDGHAPSVTFDNNFKYKLFRLHSALYQTNYDAWQPIPPGSRRIVLATNIAETSITLPDVQHVIDTGYSRQNYFDQVTQTGNFGMRWISKAEVAQRRGRAGRTREGNYYAMYSRAQYASMMDEPSPEMLRVPLDSLILRAETSQALRSGYRGAATNYARPGDILATAPTPPNPENVSAAVEQLQHLHALTISGRPTTMGAILSHFPLRPFASKSVLLGILFRCFGSLLTIGSLQADLPLVQNSDFASAANRVRKNFAGLDFDDYVADWRAAVAMARASKARDGVALKRLADDSFVRQDAFRAISRVARQCYEMFSPLFSQFRSPRSHSDETDENELIKPPSALNVNNKNTNLIKSVLLSSSSSRLAVWRGKQWIDQQGQKIMCAPRSVNHASSRSDKMLHRLYFEKGDILSYAQLRIVPEDKYPWACDTSAVSPLMAMLFAESLRLVGKSTLVVNDWLYYPIKVEGKDEDEDASARAAKIILEFRKLLDRFIMHTMSKAALHPRRLQTVIDGKMREDEFNIFFSEKEQPLRKTMVDCVVRILAIDASKRKARAVARLQIQLASMEPDDVRTKILLELQKLMEMSAA